MEIPRTDIPNCINRSSRDGRIAIIGGGTAGWMAAATLRRRLGCQVALVESPSMPSVGVGEATIPAIVDWLENMGVDESEFLNQTTGTYKLGIRFDNWVQPQHRYWHPFGICGARIDGIDLIHFWKRGLEEGWLSQHTRYADFSLQKQLCDSDRMLLNAEGQPRIANYAFHLDAGRLAQFLRQLAENEGVEHRVGHVVGATRGADGHIASVQIDGQEPLVADMFVDCSGFSSVLFAQSLEVPWIDWSSQLLCDRAIVGRTPHRTEVYPPYTVSTGLDGGWAWQIPLRETMGVGYVFSSQHLSSNDVCEELIRHAGLDPNITELREIKMRTGRRKWTWVHNCVALGLSAAFVEPLESTGIFLIQRALDELVDCLPHRPGSPAQSNTFNLRMEQAYEEIRDFVLLHYVISQRSDTPFWRDARRVTQPTSLASARTSYLASGRVTLPERPVFAEANHHFIMAGAFPIPSWHDASAERQLQRYASHDLARLFAHIQSENRAAVAMAQEQRQRRDPFLAHAYRDSAEYSLSASN